MNIVYSRVHTLISKPFLIQITLIWMTFRVKDSLNPRQDYPSDSSSASKSFLKHHSMKIKPYFSETRSETI